MSAGAAAMTRTHGRKAKDHDGMSSDEWSTPPEVTVPLFDFWGWADCDPCSNERAIIKARTAYTFGGLTLPWKTKTYQNHPYSQNDDWSVKAVRELALGNVAELVVLCMTATSTRWWRRFATKPRRNPRILCTKRLPFLGPEGLPVDSSRFEPALIYYGAKTTAFDRSFRHITMWSTWGR